MNSKFSRKIKMSQTFTGNAEQPASGVTEVIRCWKENFSILNLRKYQTDFPNFPSKTAKVCWELEFFNCSSQLKTSWQMGSSTTTIIWSPRSLFRRDSCWFAAFQDSQNYQWYGCARIAWFHDTVDGYVSKDYNGWTALGLILLSFLKKTNITLFNSVSRMKGHVPLLK